MASTNEIASGFKRFDSSIIASLNNNDVSPSFEYPPEKLNNADDWEFSGKFQVEINWQL